MSIFDSAKEFVETVKRLAAHWRVLAALAVLVAFGAIWLERKLTPRPVAPVPQQGTVPAPPTGPAPAGKEEPAAPEAPPVPDITGQINEIAARPVVLLKGQGTWEDAVKSLSEAIDKVKAAAGKAKLSANGRPFVVFTQTDDKGFHFEAMLPITKAPEGKTTLADGVEIGASPSGKTFKFQHRGPYDEIESTYEAIAAYLDEKGLDSKDLIIEEYLSDFKGDDAEVNVDIYVFLK